MQKYSYFTKLIIFGGILCTLPIVFFGIFSYIQSTKEIQKQVSRDQIQLLTQMNLNVEQTLKTVDHAFNQLVNSTLMSRLFNEPFSENDFILYKDLRKELSNTQSLYTKVDDIVIVNLAQNWLVKNSGFYRFDSYLHHSLISNQMLLPQSASWVMNPSLWFYSEEKANAAPCPYTISLVKKLPDQSLDKSGLAFANISACSFAELLKYSPRESETVMILDDQERVLFHSNPSMIGNYAINTGFIRDPFMFSQPVAQFQTELNNRKYTGTYMRSSLNNWVYISIISIDSLTQESKQIGRFTILTCVIIVAVFAVIAWLGSRRMYNPIQALMNQIGGKVPFGGNERINEFEIINDRVQDLFRSQDRHRQEARQYLQQASAFFLIKMFQGKLRRAEFNEKMELFGFKDKVSEWRTCTVITLQIDTLENTSYAREDIELLLFAINNITEEIIPEEDRLPPVVIDQTQVTLIGSRSGVPAEYNNFMYALTESIQRTVREVLKLKISIGISLPSDEPQKASIAYREGLEALKQRIHLGENVIVPYANINAGKHQRHIDYPHLTENELFDAIVLADETKSRQYLRQFMQLIFKYEMTPQEYQVAMVRLLNNLMIAVQESGVALKKLQPEGGSLYEELNALHVPGEIEEWFWSRVICRLIRIFQDRHNSQYQTISEKIIELIHKYYDTDVSIEQCASKLHYNANYLSGVFRKETNQTFSEYLSEYRLNMAKKWLADTGITIKDIAEKLQYMNSQNFIRSFRKQEGMTPGKYRESIRKNNY